MDAESWRQVRSKMYSEVTDIEKHVRPYEYSSPERCHATDERICTFFVEELRKAKSSLFELTEIAYQKRQDRTSDTIRLLRDDIDIFSDEIKARSCRFKDIPAVFMEKLVRYDYEIVKGLKELNFILEKAQKTALEGHRLDTDNIKERIGRLVTMFKQREALTNVHEIALERSFARMKREISGSV